MLGFWEKAVFVFCWGSNTLDNNDWDGQYSVHMCQWCKKYERKKERLEWESAVPTELIPPPTWLCQQMLQTWMPTVDGSIHCLSLNYSSVFLFFPQRPLNQKGDQGTVLYNMLQETTCVAILKRRLWACTRDLEDRPLNKAAQILNSLHSKLGLAWVLHQREGKTYPLLPHHRVTKSLLSKMAALWLLPPTLQLNYLPHSLKFLGFLGNSSLLRTSHLSKWISKSKESS